MVQTARMTILMEHPVTCGNMREPVGEPDWRLVRIVIDAETAFQGRTQAELCQSAGIDRTVFTSMTRGRGVSDAILRRIEGALALPREFLHYVATNDYDAMAETSASPDLIRFVRRRATGNVEDTTAS